MNISVIIPVYNVAKYIEECLQSISSQTFREGVECILVDDCGQDNSIELAESYISKDNSGISFSIVKHPQNKGLSAARNTGVKFAKGDYLLFVDSDDKLFPESLEKLYELTQKYKGVDLVQGSTYAEGTKVFLLDDKKYPEYTNNIKWISQSLLTFYIPDPAWNRLIRKELFLSKSLYFAEGFIQEDTIWSYTLHDNILNMAFCFTPTYYYRTNPAGIMKSANRFKEASSFCRVFNYVYYKMLEQKSVTADEVKYLEKNARRAVNGIGEEAFNLLAIKNNALFHYLILLSSNSWNHRGVIKKLYKRLMIPVLRLLLSIKKLFRTQAIYDM